MLKGKKNFQIKEKLTEVVTSRDALQEIMKDFPKDERKLYQIQTQIRKKKRVPERVNKLINTKVQFSHLLLSSKDNYLKQN